MSGSTTKNGRYYQDFTIVDSVQDTIPRIVQQDSTVSLSTQDSLPPVIESLPEDSFSPEDIQMLFDQSNQRQETIDSFSQDLGRSHIPAVITEAPETTILIDSGHAIFSVDSVRFLPVPEFSLDLPRFSYKKQEDSGSVFIESLQGEHAQGEAKPDVVMTHPNSKQDLVAKEKLVVSDDWILGVMLVSFVVLAWIRLFYNKFLSPTFVAVINQQVSHNLFRDKSGVSIRVSSGLNLIFYLNGGLYLYLLVQRLEVEFFGFGSFWTFSLLCLILIGFYLAKQIVTSLVGFISLTQMVFKEYMHNVFLFNKSLGLVLFPVVLGMVYMSDLLAPFFLYSGIAFVGIAYLLRLIRGFQIFIKEGVSILYWILYLCALEILPIVLFLKLSGLLVW